MLGFTKFKINRLVNRRELYSNFSYNKWNQLDTGSKWKCLQQLENHFAAEQGRPAVKVLPISSKEAEEPMVDMTQTRMLYILIVIW